MSIPLDRASENGYRAGIVREKILYCYCSHTFVVVWLSGLIISMQHLPASQVLPVGHALPQEPQLFQSVRRSTHVPPQSVFPRIPQFTGGFVTVMAGFVVCAVDTTQIPFRQGEGD